MVFQDGHKYVNTEQEYRVPVVFDNLITKGEMPVTIGVFINPGHAGGELPADPWRASNRSFEYDTLSDQYARFLLEEILPEVGKEHQADRRSRAAARSAASARAASARGPSPGSGPTVQQGAQPRRQLHQHPRRRTSTPR